MLDFEDNTNQDTHVMQDTEQHEGTKIEPSLESEKTKRTQENAVPPCHPHTYSGSGIEGDNSADTIPAGVNIIVVGSIFCPPSSHRLNILPHKKKLSHY